MAKNVATGQTGRKLIRFDIRNGGRRGGLSRAGHGSDEPAQMVGRFRAGTTFRFEQARWVRAFARDLHEKRN